MSWAASVKAARSASSGPRVMAVCWPLDTACAASCGAAAASPRSARAAAARPSADRSDSSVLALRPSQMPTRLSLWLCALRSRLGSLWVMLSSVSALVLTVAWEASAPSFFSAARACSAMCCKFICGSPIGRIYWPPRCARARSAGPPMDTTMGCFLPQ